MVRRDEAQIVITLHPKAIEDHLYLVRGPYDVLFLVLVRLLALAGRKRKARSSLKEISLLLKIVVESLR